nr:zinc finger, CCHC-type, retrotransposon Gag domain protein [Tanacetum cinerariifolium]
IRDLERLGIELFVSGQQGYWASLRIERDLISQIKEAQKEDSEIWTIVENLDKQVKIEHQRASGLLQQLDIPVFANMRRVGKGFFGVDTPLFEGMIVAQQADDVADEGDAGVDVDVVPAAAEPFIPSPTPTTQPPPPS